MWQLPLAPQQRPDRRLLGPWDPLLRIGCATCHVPTQASSLMRKKQFRFLRSSRQYHSSSRKTRPAREKHNGPPHHVVDHVLTRLGVRESIEKFASKLEWTGGIESSDAGAGAQGECNHLHIRLNSQVPRLPRHCGIERHSCGQFKTCETRAPLQLLIQSGTRRPQPIKPLVAPSDERRPSELCHAQRFQDSFDSIRAARHQCLRLVVEWEWTWTMEDFRALRARNETRPCKP